MKTPSNLREAQDAQPLEDAVRKWLGRHGFPLEFRVARTFAKHDFAVTPSHYVDVPGARTPREIDVLAAHTRTMFSDKMSFE